MAAFGLFMVAALPAGAQTAAPRAAATTQAPSRSIEAIFDALDTDKDKALSPREFQMGYSRLARAIALEMRLRGQFQGLDGNRNGALESTEYANLELVKRAGKTAPSLDAFDTDKDQKLNFSEYLVALRQLSAAQPAASVKK